MSDDARPNSLDALIAAQRHRCRLFRSNYFAPEANQGPLLGIFITGPLGFIIGGLAGLVYAHVNANRKG